MPDFTPSNLSSVSLNTRHFNNTQIQLTEDLTQTVNQTKPVIIINLRSVIPKYEIQIYEEQNKKSNIY